MQDKRFPTDLFFYSQNMSIHKNHELINRSISVKLLRNKFGLKNHLFVKLKIHSNHSIQANRSISLFLSEK